MLWIVLWILLAVCGGIVWYSISGLDKDTEGY
jgi:hypothetical protein